MNHQHMDTEPAIVRARIAIFEAVATERERQDGQYGAAIHRGYGYADWLAVLTAEVGEVADHVADLAHYNRIDADAYRAELVQVAAVAIATIEWLEAERQEGAA